METRNCVNRRQSLACAITFACSSIALNFAVGAQNAAEQTAPVEEEITITGSRIRYTDGMATPTPVTALTPEELASFEPGATVAEQLDALPQFFATQTAQRGGLALSGDAGATVPSSTWWNGSVRYRGQRAGGATWDVGLAVQNLFDRDPPIIPFGTAGAQGLLSNQYDVFGRRYNLSFNISM